MPRPQLLAACLLIALAAALACAPRLMPAPDLYQSGTAPVFGELDPALAGPTIDVFYLTDRAREPDKEGRIRFGHGRSPSLAFGSAKVEIGDGLSWEDVTRSSVEGQGALPRPRLRVTSIEEQGRFPATPYQYRLVSPGEVEVAPEVLAERAAAFEAAGAEVRRRLARTPRKEVYLFVHGVNTSFETAAIQMAEGWHFLGREGVPVAYTWPAKHGSALSYAYDRESGEFTNFHLKEVLRALGAMPEVEKVHVIAHSRGTDVASTAIRELALEARGTGRKARDLYKIENLVLIAADLDFGVVMQRMVAEALGSSVGRVTVYGYSKDNALAAANALLRSQMRVGEISADELTEADREMLQQITGLDVISYDGRTGGAFGHFYFLENPAISSDIVALLRFGDRPGEGLRKGLLRSQKASNFWTIDDDYASKAVPVR